MQGEMNVEVAARTVVTTVWSDSTLITVSYMGLFNIT